MKKVLLQLAAIGLPLLVIAQTETTLPSLDRLQQATYVNPAVIPSYSGSVGTPIFPNLSLGINLNALNARMAINSMDTGYLSASKLYKELNDNNIGIEHNLMIELMHVRVKIKDWHWGLHVSSRVSAQIGLSKEFLGFAALGNDYFAGKTMDASSTVINVLAFNEVGLSAAKKFGKLSVGARLKMYSGAGVVQTDNISFKWQQPSDATGEIKVTTSAKIQAAGIPYLLDSLNGKKYEGNNTNVGDYLGTKNAGFGFDLGATYDLTSKLKVSASVTDIGYINWKNNAYTYTSNEATATYSGFAYDEIDKSKERKQEFDSLLNIITPVGEEKTFKTTMPWRYFLSTSYQVNKKNTVGLMFQSRKFLDGTRNALTINYTHRFGKKLDFTTNYSIIGNNYANIGMGIAAKTGIFQWYLVNDNIFAYIKPSTMQVFTFRFGMNIIWGDLTKY